MKRAIYLFLTLFLISCSKDDKSSENQTFLQKYDGYGFVYENDTGSETGSEYVFFSDSEYFLKYASVYGGDSECVLVREESVFDSEEGEGYNLSILTNEGDTLLIEIEYAYEDGEVEIDQLEYSINSQGDVMTYTLIVDSDTYTDTFYRTSETYSDLCN